MAEMAPVTPLLETVALSRKFGGVEAVKSVDFRLERGEIRALIGPNGAGKTTLVNMISGRISPTSGKVVFKELDITGMTADARVAIGIAYTFQLIGIFKNLTVHENVALAVQRKLMSGIRERLALSQDTLAKRVDAVLAEVGLHATRNKPASSLPYGHQRLLEVSMALALTPELLILDEPTQGLAPAEIAALSQLIRSIARTVTILLIEHNMEVVLDLSRRITVMDQGSIIAEGTPEEIAANLDVQRVYLGP